VRVGIDFAAFLRSGSGESSFLLGRTPSLLGLARWLSGVIGSVSVRSSLFSVEPKRLPTLLRSPRESPLSAPGSLEKNRPILKFRIFPTQCNHIIATFLPLAILFNMLSSRILQSQRLFTFATPTVYRGPNRSPSLRHYEKHQKTQRTHAHPQFEHLRSR
jgi:hypothetical protein